MRQQDARQNWGVAMTCRLFELVGKDDLRFSPYSWRARMALKHKRLDAAYEPCKFTDKDKLAFANSKTVPVLTDGTNVVTDSWAIACYLEDAYPNAPSLFDGEVGRGLSRVLNLWVDRTLISAIAKAIMGELFENVHPDDKAYFRVTRENRFGVTLEELVADRAQHQEALARDFAPLRAAAREQPFLCGARPAYGDFIVFGCLQWARCAAPTPILAADDPLAAWFETMLDLFDGYGRGAKLPAAG